MLAADDFEGRRPGTRGEEKTVAFLTAQFRKFGLKPGNGDSYVQQVPLVEILAADDATLTVAGRGGSQALALRQGHAHLDEARGSRRRSSRESELVFVGYGIVAPEYQWNDYAHLDVRGKTVLVLAGDPGYRSKDPTLFKGTAMSGYGRWTYKVEEATRQGAAGVLLIHDAAASGYGWSAVENTWSGPQLELASSDNAGRAAIEGWITGRCRALAVRAGRAGLRGAVDRGRAPRVSGERHGPQGRCAGAQFHSPFQLRQRDRACCRAQSASTSM